MNSFFVPQLGSQIYAMAGMATGSSCRPTSPAPSRASARNISGAGFSDMRFEVEALPADGFQAWVAGDARQAAARSTPVAYGRLAPARASADKPADLRHA